MRLTAKAFTAECRGLPGILRLAVVCPDREGGRAMRPGQDQPVQSIFQVPAVAWKVQRGWASVPVDLGPANAESSH